MHVHPKRIRRLNEKAVGTGPVVYWMSRDCRVSDNWALLYAQEQAHALNRPLYVVYNLVSGFLGGGMRQWDFKVRGLQEVENGLAKHNIPFFLLHDATGDASVDLLTDFFNTHDVGLVVTDFSSVRTMLAWASNVAKKVDVSVVQVDAHNIVPCWVTSDKQEFGAYTIRPKIKKHLSEFLVPFPTLKASVTPSSLNVPSIDWDALLKHSSIDTSVAPVTWCTAGEHAAHKRLSVFIHDILSRYDAERNDPLADAQSDLSPYLHYGHIAPARVALEISALPQNKNTEAFLEELIVRRELSDNFCFYNQYYDSPEGFPDWAKRTIAKAEKDRRAYIYTLEQFESAQTHEALWNAAQREMMMRGKLHGYMRMYWAKKILEWTPNAETAMRIAIYLNDKYELDGRDPNGYAGIAWSIGGVHDRAWFDRPIFGQIRYMNENGCRSKFDVDAYIARYTI